MTWPQTGASHYLNRRWPILWSYTCTTRSQWVEWTAQFSYALKGTRCQICDYTLCVYNNGIFFSYLQLKLHKTQEMQDVLSLCGLCRSYHFNDIILTHWSLNKMAVILLMPYLSAFSCEIQIISLPFIRQNSTQIARFMGPTWDRTWSCRSQMGPMLAPWTLLSGNWQNVSCVWGDGLAANRQ